MEIVTYIIPVRNPKADLLDTIASIDTEFVFEIIVIDDFSETGLEFFDKALSVEKVKIIGNEYGRGIVGALNTGLKYAVTLYLARLDCGDIDLPGRLSAQLEAMVTDKKIDLVAGAMLQRDKEGKTYLLKPRLSYAFGALSPFSRLPHPTWLLRKSSIVKKYTSEAVRCEDYLFLLHNDPAIKIINRPLVVYDVDARLNFKLETISAFKKSASFFKSTSNLLGGFFVAVMYFLIRLIRISLSNTKRSIGSKREVLND